MRILEAGIARAHRLYVARCPDCQTKFEFRRDEARLLSDTRLNHMLAVKCPLALCGETVYVRS